MYTLKSKQFEGQSATGISAVRAFSRGSSVTSGTEPLSARCPNDKWVHLPFVRRHRHRYGIEVASPGNKNKLFQQRNRKQIAFLPRSLDLWPHTTMSSRV